MTQAAEASNVNTAWGSAIGGLLGSWFGPPGAIIGAVVGGFAQNTVQPYLADVVNEMLAGYGIEGTQWVGRRVLQRLSPQQQAQINGHLQCAFRDAVREALYDIGGKRCFPVEWKPDRAVPAKVVYTCQTDDECAPLIELVGGITSGALLPLDPPDSQPAARADTYLLPNTISDLTNALFAHLLPPDAPFRSLRTLPELERHLRRHLLDRTMVHLGETLKADTGSWRAFNRLLLEAMHDTLAEIGQGQATIRQQLTAIQQQLADPAFTQRFADTTPNLLQLTGQIKKNTDDSRSTVLNAVTTQNTAIMERLREGFGAVLDQLAEIKAGVQTIIEATAHPRPTPTKPTILAPPDFVGREDEIATIGQALRRATTGRTAAVYGIYGMSGMGKSAIAQQVAANLVHDFPNGCYLLALNGMTDAWMRPEQMLTACIQAFGGEIEAQRPYSVDELQALFKAVMQGKRALIVADNARDKAQVDRLVPLAPGCALLITSQERFTLPGMPQPYELKALPLPMAEALLRERCDRVGAFAAALAAQASCVPHALVLIAGRLSEDITQDVEDYLNQLKDERTRLSSMDDIGAPDDPRYSVRAALNLSYRALDPTLQNVLRQLGAFAGSFTLEIADALVTLSPDAPPTQRALARLVQRSLLQYDAATNRYTLHDFVRALIRAEAHRHGEDNELAARHANLFSALMREADDQQRYYVMLTEMAELRQAYAWAIEQDLNLAQNLIADSAELMAQFNLVREHWGWCEEALQRAKGIDESGMVAQAWLSLGNTLQRVANLPDEDRRQRLYDALAAYDQALIYRRPDTAPLAYAMTQNNRGNVLQALANLPDEDRRQRLYDALAAYDQALIHRRPDTAPLAYATTQNNRGNVLTDLANLPDEDRRQRLYDALAAYDQALIYRRPDTAPLDYAMTQNNRGNVLTDLANLPDEDRRQRLYDALAAYDQALHHYRPDTAPLDYATTQNNRGNVLTDLANLPDEDRRQRLYDALAAYDQALIYRRPDTAPLNYAMTQNNRGNVLTDLANLPDEDRRQRLYDALAAYDQALHHYRPDTAPLDYATTQNNRGLVLTDLANLPDEDRRQRLYDALAAYDQALIHRRPDTAPLAYATTQNNRGNVLTDLANLPDEDRRQRLYDALAAYDQALIYWRPDTGPLAYAMTQGNLANLYMYLASLPGEDRQHRLFSALQAVWTAFTLFVQLQHAVYAEMATRQLHRIKKQCGADFADLWQQLDAGPAPDWLR